MSHGQMDMSDGHAWQVMQDGVVFAALNHQGGPRGGTEVVAPNWWMGMAARDTPHGRLTLTGMFSLDAATVGTSGYREIFQAGEALAGRPLIDRQHPHDFFMQLAAAWRLPVNASTAVTLAGGPVGEPALGPVAFMHRASAADNPLAPLAHHTLDSTHIAFGVATAAVDHGAWTIEGSLFNGREPDEHRWNVDFGRLDSVSARVWFRPNAEWELQASSGRLVDPEVLEPGVTVRSTASASWTRARGASFLALTAAYGRNDTAGGARDAVLVEAARRTDANTIYVRGEVVQLETALLLTDEVVPGPAGAARDRVRAVTIGGVRNLPAWRGFETGIGADVSIYGVPDALQSAYAAHPVSFQIYVRLRPPAGPMGRMKGQK